MALPYWRAPLPVKWRRKENLEGSLPDGRRPGQAEGSTASVSLRYTNSPDKLGGSFRACIDTYAFFRFRFFEEELKRGSLPFYIPDPFLNDIALSTDEGDLVTTDEDDLIVTAYMKRAKFDPNSPAPTYRGIGINAWVDISFQLVLYN